MDINIAAVTGPVTLAHDTELFGTVVGTVIVPSGVRLEMHGLIQGDLIARPGAKAVIHATVTGTVVNLGAEITIRGVVGAVHDIDGRHRTRLTETAWLLS